MNTRRFILFLTAWTALSVTVYAANPAPGPRGGDVTHISTLLSEGSVEEAIGEMRELVELQPAVAAPQLRGGWVQALIDADHPAEAAELAQAAIVELAGDTYAVVGLQRQRVRALLKAGKASEALVAAKGFFNVCNMANTREALMLCEECLRAAYPKDAAIITRFRNEQFAGASTRPAMMPKPGTQVLDTIELDPAPYEAAIERYDPDRYLIHGSEFRDLTAQGNLLLLSGKVGQAREVFERARRVAEEDQKLAANENIAKAIRAEVRSIGAANAWIAELRKEDSP